jgi:hypothetical protein
LEGAVDRKAFLGLGFVLKLSAHGELVKTKEDVKDVKDLRERFKGVQLLMFDEVSMIRFLSRCRWFS